MLFSLTIDMEVHKHPEYLVGLIAQVKSFKKSAEIASQVLVSSYCY